MMKKTVLSFLSLLFPTLVFAANNNSSSLSFAPPPSDYSVIFLGNIFGVVDGVLHGTGSQIMGNMFGVFNSAVLALGGIIIMYTLLVSTMNTAQEGQMLGQKWSSIWVPMRSTLGLALLIPKASGYCLMQIFVMWIVVQGVGAADKVWAAALSYLNRGGVIVQTQMKPAVSLGSGDTSVAQGASTILTAEACMYGLQTILSNQRELYLNSMQSQSGASGPCSGTPSATMKDFCTTAVPDFISTVNAVAVQTKAQTAAEGSKSPPPTNFSVEMPNLDSNSPYAFLNGICGTLKWNAFSAADLGIVQKNISSITSNELQTAQTSRAIAIQQMYMDLAPVARSMVLNSPRLNPQQTNSNKGGSSSTQSNFSPIAVQQFGVPFLSSGTPCTTVSANCVMWGEDPSSTAPPLFNGSEFLGAIADYNGIMLPTLNLVSQAQSNKSASDERKFIEQANTQGWILAGSYFFNLARLNSSDIKSANLTDKDTGLDTSSSVFDENNISPAFENGQCSGKYANLCVWMNKDPTLAKQVIGLINGSTIGTTYTKPSVTTTNHRAVSGPPSSTVYGFVNNSIMVNLPGQPGLVPPQFALKFNIDISMGSLQLQSQDFPCGKVKIMFFSFCLGSLLGNVFYNLIIKNLFNFFLNMVAPIINTVVMTFLAYPLIGIASIFQQGVAIIQQPTVNPVVALANMGVSYINFASDLWILLIGLSISTSLIPLFGLFIMPLIAMTLPLLLAWLGVMVSIGFVTAYYIPVLPYMIFTFGSIAWLMAVIEAMVAAPIVALGVTHPEGHDAFGKGEQAIMILMNVFLRPSMMIIGYIAAIALSYVSVWIINAGFSNAIAFIQGTASGIQWNYSASSAQSAAETAASMASMNTGYGSWAGIYGFFFAVLIYTTMYLVVVQRSFTLISYLPDKVLRWIGGQPEGIGEQAAQWGDEVKKQVGEEGTKAASKAGAQRDQMLQGYTEKGLGKLKGAASSAKSSVSAKGGSDGGDSTKGGIMPE